MPNLELFPNAWTASRTVVACDDVTRIELQAVGGVVLYAIGPPYENANGSQRADSSR
jgi:hypothetical protein